MATAVGIAKRGPSVLANCTTTAVSKAFSVKGDRADARKVTDSRERPQPPRAPQQAGAGGPGARRIPTRLISVDNVLQYASEIPSGQARGPPGRRNIPPGLRRNISAGPGPGSRVTPQNVPGRSTKVSEKLVLIPETIKEKEGSDDEDVKGDEHRPLRDKEMDELRTKGGLRGKSYAEMLPKERRKDKLARVTAYCTAQGYKLKANASFVRERHGAKTKLYDDCLYTVYHLPLLTGAEGYRVRSSPVLKNPGGKAVLDEEIERSERRDYHEGYFEDTDTYGVRGGEESPRNESDDDKARREESSRLTREEERALDHGTRLDSPNRIAPDATTFAEMFVFSYGVVVFWNFTEHQEKDILADLTFAEALTGVLIVSRPQDESDFETEELHFEYSPLVDRPRVFNDMITLRSGDHMIKLAMSHAIAQSTKLSFFEEKMSQTMLDAQYVPKRLALTGQLGMSRKEIVKILGQLFKSRVDVNLSSNILDVPKFFWDSEPTLHPLYFAIREYLEIGPRIKVLNERCRVFLDLAEILSDSIADTKMSTITWIIIVLIVISIGVTVSEVVLRFALLEKEKGKGRAIDSVVNLGMNNAPILTVSDDNTSTTATLSGIGRGLSPEEVSKLCGMDIVGQTIADLGYC